MAGYLAVGVAAVINLFNPAVVFIHSPLFDIDRRCSTRWSSGPASALPPSFAECRILRREGTKRQGRSRGSSAPDGCGGPRGGVKTKKPAADERQKDAEKQ